MKGMAIAQVPDEQSMIDMAAYMEFMAPPESLPITVDGDPEEGRKLYEASCIACHGEHGEGSTVLGSPRLSNQHDWYLLRQLKDFLSGARGQQRDDIFGTQMRYMGAAGGHRAEAKGRNRLHRHVQIHRTARLTPWETNCAAARSCAVLPRLT